MTPEKVYKGLNGETLTGQDHDPALKVAINKNDMRMGDLFIDSIGDANSRHVVIFEKWAYEQRGGYGTDYRTRSYGLGGDQYKARRLKNITG